MQGRIETVQIGCGDGPAYQREAGVLGELYGALLDMERYDAGYVKLRRPDGARPEIGFENGDDVRPRWPDPAYPQQLHLDIEVADMEVADGLARRHGAALLRDNGARHRIYADPVGHPFCVHAAPGAASGRLARIVFDCPSPRALAGFYAELLAMPNRTVDTDDVVEITGSPEEPRLAFQRAAGPAPKWPDPAHPAQLHLDLSFDEPYVALDIMDRLGATRLACLRMHAVFADPAGHPFCGPAHGYVTVQGIPAGVTSVHDFPPDWRPEPLPFTRAEIIAAVAEVADDADFSDPGGGRLSRPGVQLEFRIPDGERFKSLLIGFGTSDRTLVDPILRDILDRLGVGAFDAEAPGNVFV